MEDGRDGRAVLPAGVSHGACAIIGGRVSAQPGRPMVTPGLVGRTVGAMHGAVDGADVAVPAALERGREQQGEHRQ
jgi:hypothetical protein